MLYYQSMNSPMGDIMVVANDHGITEVAFQQGAVPVIVPTESSDTIVLANQHSGRRVPDHLARAITQLDQYFSGRRTTFDLPLAQQGTDFQQRVWQALTDIPYASTCSYGELAQQLGKPKAMRAVGSANGKNKIAIIVPCHRVIGKNNKLTGYAGGLALKAQLLSLENARFTP
ncbi:methylated-DNA--[protein]-cysteine S-methyltransferase [Thalassotalea ponticola]|uniref:methylated-DNA--[protein]-cysteine S-methyltransferase n=1 Tax=Thalassotalea ponticola TaxID=1523392 RepID=UPI0025B5F3C0|nr:methylated-DNA--[protein]-cysteine S-methyltransferase [Thalassotalea ponticola]MDN3653207.1 methylated-DNA--[protein]-cysteine S-methyltransferase [Thalassotalea ponticola]